ncbi:hypothetical protein SAMN04487944_1049 [Gracilibacillus ureilyticus]|uniref:Uncharacterized protein n=1 Tax=Gracilibacillus ureilyticus TaxID=531814 RepID=A0A1H9NXY4_9BACI|nr:DUF6470 family protein [Gracilibacillus ureilyticus]SER40790.1 hypothetical protein SAMN04487944_1049 [Gracilibacillus ureilyticus]
MQLPQIRIQSQNAILGLKINNAQLTIDSGPAKQTIKQPQADLRISTKPGKLTIDQSKALADVGIIPTEESVRKMAKEAMQTAIEGSKKTRRQGDMLMKIENGGNLLAQVAKQNGERPMKQFNIGWIPSGDAVKFHYEQAEVDIEARANKPQIEIQPTKNKFDYRPGGVEKYLEQKNWIDISFVNVKFVGNNFEMEI